MPDIEYLKKIDKSRVIETDSGIYFVQFAGENLGDENEKKLISVTNALLSTVGPKRTTGPKRTVGNDPAYLENFKEVFPQTYKYAEAQQLPVGFPSGPILVMADRKTTDEWVIYTLFGGAGVLFLWGANNLRKIPSDIRMTRRHFVFATAKIFAAGLLAMKGAGLLALNSEPQVKLPETIPPEQLFAATLAEALEQSSLKIRKERKLESKPVIYLLILPEHKPLLDYLKNKGARDRILNAYKDFLKDAIPQLKTEGTTNKGTKELNDFYQNWSLAMYAQKNGKWGLQNYELPIFK